MNVILHILIAAIGFGLLIGLVAGIPTFLVGLVLYFNAKILRGKKAEIPVVTDEELLDIDKELKKALETYSITNPDVESKILDELLKKHGYVYDAKTKAFKKA